MATVHPSQRIVADDADDLAALKAHLDAVGYTAGETVLATRSDDDGALTVTIDYPTWVL